MKAVAPSATIVTPSVARRLQFAALLATLTIPSAVRDLCAQTRPAPRNAKDVMARHAAATGIAPNELRPARTVVVMTMPMGPGVESRVETFVSPPLRIYMKTTMSGAQAIPGMGTMHAGFDGTTAWAITEATGPMILPAEQAQELRRQARGQSAGADDGTLTLRGESKLDGRKVWVVDGVGADSGRFTQYYDDESGLLVAMDAGDYKSPGKPMLAFRDYKRFGSILMATSLVTRLPTGDSLVARVVEFEQKAIPDSVFTLPASVKALLAKPPATRKP